MKQLYVRKTTGDQMENNLIPMINIIFLLLIFFMIAGHISQQAKPKKLSLATAESLVKVDPASQTISVTKKGEYYRNNALTSLDAIKTFYAGHPDITKVNLQVDKQVTSGELDALLDVFRTLSINEVAVTVLKVTP